MCKTISIDASNIVDTNKILKSIQNGKYVYKKYIKIKNHLYNKDDRRCKIKQQALAHSLIIDELENKNIIFSSSVKRLKSGILLLLFETEIPLRIHRFHSL